MRFQLLSAALATGALASAIPAKLQSRQSANVGYLAAVFKGDVPQVFFNIAPASSPSSFSPVKGGQAILIPTKGTQGARDPYIFRSVDQSKVRYFVQFANKTATLMPISITSWPQILTLARPTGVMHRLMAQGASLYGNPTMASIGQQITSLN